MYCHVIPSDSGVRVGSSHFCLWLHDGFVEGGCWCTPANERWALSTTRFQGNLHREGGSGEGRGVCGGIREQGREGGGEEWGGGGGGRWREGRGKEGRKGEKSEVVEGVSEGY